VSSSKQQKNMRADKEGKSFRITFFRKKEKTITKELQHRRMDEKSSTDDF
jgi:hypothetical protein